MKGEKKTTKKKEAKKKIKKKSLALPINSHAKSSEARLFCLDKLMARQGEDFLFGKDDYGN